MGKPKCVKLDGIAVERRGACGFDSSIIEPDKWSDRRKSYFRCRYGPPGATTSGTEGGKARREEGRRSEIRVKEGTTNRPRRQIRLRRYSTNAELEHPIEAGRKRGGGKRVAGYGEEERKGRGEGPARE